MNKSIKIKLISDFVLLFVGLYSSRDNCGICVFNGHSGGLTHMMFSPDGPCLYTGARMDHEIICWDLRNPGKVLFSLYRNVATNQRIYFDLTPDGNTLVSGKFLADC